MRNGSLTMGNPLTGLWQSRKFLVLLMDAVVSIVLHYFGGPGVEFLIGALQPVALAFIYAVSIEDAAEKGRVIGHIYEWKISAIRALLQSRKFLILLLDTIISITLHFFGGPDMAFLIGIMQPVAMMLILAIAKEDAAALKHGRHIRSRPG